MSARLITARDINGALEERFDSTSPYIYKNVIVLLLYWKDADLDFKSEADAMESLFRTKLHYNTVLRFEIPSENSNIALNDEIHRVCQMFGIPRSLIIIHYGGHGDPDDVRTGNQALPSQKCVWAAKNDSTDEAVLNWSYIQPQLGLWQKCDFLIILDCCFGAQAARAAPSRVIPSNVELLAAAPMGCLTNGPGRNSFTTAFIEAVESALTQKVYPGISDLYHELCAEGTRLIQTPVHFPHGTQTTICLQPHSSSLSTNSMRQSETKLVMEMIIRGPIDYSLLDRVRRWLINYVPPEVAGLKVTELVQRATAAQDFIMPTLSDTQSQRAASRSLTIDAMSQESKSEMKRAWTAFNWSLMENLKRFFSSNGTPNDTAKKVGSATCNDSGTLDEAKVRLFLAHFDENIAQLASAIERNVLSVADLLEEVNVEAAIQDAASQDLGLVSALKMRLENLRFENALRHNSLARNDHFTEFRSDLTALKACSVVNEVHPRYGRVLVEYSYYAAEDTGAQQRNDARMEHLVKLLSNSNPDFHTLTCLGWTPMRAQHRYGLLFQNPCEMSQQPITLFEILGPPGRERPSFQPPSLGQRFRIAQAIGQALLKWHTVSWVHQSVSSLNVIFFPKGASKTIDYSKPYLAGFSFSRLTSHHSTPRQSTNDILRDVYQHPERQGARPSERHTKEHDLYSFGVLLFEIGFWGRAPDFFSKLVQREQVGAIRGKMLSRVEHLGPEMGTSYALATKLCLEQNFQIPEDDKVQSRLARLFEYKVLRKLDVGVMLDE